MKRALAALCLLSFGLGFVGCGSGDGPVATDSRSGASHVLRAETEYYLAGPQQGRPPDGKLAAGTRVKLVSESGSYSVVTTETPPPITAHVSTSSLEKLGSR